MDNQVPVEGGSSEPVPTKRCGTCERDIELPKFRMHEIGCARSNYKCAVCGEIVAKSEKEEHDKEAHTKVPCQYCNVEFSKKDHEPHESSCFAKPKPCRYCEQVI
jgi:DNA-directed RNA polymerase subunit RPC12/RpoP